MGPSLLRLAAVGGGLLGSVTEPRMPCPAGDPFNRGGRGRRGRPAGRAAGGVAGRRRSLHWGRAGLLRRSAVWARGRLAGWLLPMGGRPVGAAGGFTSLRPARLCFRGCPRSSRWAFLVRHGRLVDGPRQRARRVPSRGLVLAADVATCRAGAEVAPAMAALPPTRPRPASALGVDRIIAASVRSAAAVPGPVSQLRVICPANEPRSAVEIRDGEDSHSLGRLALSAAFGWPSTGRPVREARSGCVWLSWTLGSFPLPTLRLRSTPDHASGRTTRCFTGNAQSTPPDDEWAERRTALAHHGSIGELRHAYEFPRHWAEQRSALPGTVRRRLVRCRSSDSRARRDGPVLRAGQPGLRAGQPGLRVSRPGSCVRLPRQRSLCQVWTFCTVIVENAGDSADVVGSLRSRPG